MHNSQHTFRYFIYARKSTEHGDRQLLSIPAQLGEAEQIIKRGNLNLVGEPFTEEKSAKKPGRSLFNEMLKRIEKGEADSVICWKLDRLARNPIDGGRIMDLLQRGILKEIRTPSAVYTPLTNVIVLAVEFGMANQFIRDLSTNVKRGQRRKAELGIPHGLAQIGFINDKNGEKGGRRWLVDELRLPLIKELFSLFLTGKYSVRRLWKIAQDELHLKTVVRKKSGGKPLSLSYFYKMLSNPVYAGFFYYENLRYDLDPHLPRVVTEDQYWLVQELLGRRGRPHSKTKRKATYSGFIYCSKHKCGVTADHKSHVVCSNCKRRFSNVTRQDCPKCQLPIVKMNTPIFRSYVYYQSSRSRKMRNEKALAIEEKEIDKFLISYLERKFIISPSLSRWMISHIDLLWNQKTVVKKAIALSKKSAINRANKQRIELIRMRSTGMIGDEDFWKLKKEVEDNITQAEAVTDEKDWTQRAKEIVQLSTTMAQILRNGSVTEKREVLAAWRSNLELKGKKLLVINTNSVQAYIEMLEAVRAQNFEVEPLKGADSSVQNDDYSNLNPSLSAGWQIVRTCILQEMEEDVKGEMKSSP